MNCQTLMRILLLVPLLGMGCASESSKGSSKALYTISETLEVNVEDIGKEIQLRYNQNLFFHFEIDPAAPGDWELVDYDKRTLRFLSDTPRTTPGYWGILLRGNAIGSGFVTLRFTPNEGEGISRDVKFEISVHR